MYLLQLSKSMQRFFATNKKTIEFKEGTILSYKINFINFTKSGEKYHWFFIINK